MYQSNIGYGGAIYMIGTTASFTTPVFSGNSGYHGGMEQHAYLCFFLTCISAAIFADAGQQTTLNIVNGAFSTNRATGKGGAMYVGAQPGVTVTGKVTASLVDTDYLYNSAGQGGAIYAQSSFLLDISDAQFIGNLADFSLARVFSVVHFFFKVDDRTYLYLY